LYKYSFALAENSRNTYDISTYLQVNISVNIENEMMEKNDDRVNVHQDCIQNVLANIFASATSKAFIQPNAEYKNSPPGYISKPKREYNKQSRIQALIKIIDKCRYIVAFLVQIIYIADWTGPVTINSFFLRINKKWNRPHINLKEPRCLEAMLLIVMYLTGPRC